MANNTPIIKTSRMTLRNINESDADNIVLWRSDPDVYRFFLSPHVITKEEHLNWFSKRYLQDENRCDWMAIDSRGQSIGVFGIRRECEDSDTAEISYILAPACRGLGYAHEAMVALLEFLKNMWKTNYVIAEIHKDNKSSIRFVKRLGMKFHSKVNDFLTYRMLLVSDIAKTIYFRVDGNSYVGVGHVMRCLSIAEQIKVIGGKVVFITADDSVKSLIEKRGFDTICLNSQWNNLNSEMDKVCTLLDVNNVSIILIDSYYVTKEYLKVLQKHAKVYYIDDIHIMEYPVDTLINYNIYGEDMGYSKECYKNLFIGPQYAPLRSEFMNKKCRTYNGLKKILITSGGTDKYNIIGNILDTFSQSADFLKKEYYCVLGQFNKNIDVLKAKYADNSNVHLLINIDNMSYYMDLCDVAITAGGSTCYELCACGLPAVIYTLADNQNRIATTFSRKGIIPWIGDVRTDIEGCINKLFAELKFIDERVCWEQRSKKMQELVDGQGAVKLAKVLMEIE